MIPKSCEAGFRTTIIRRKKSRMRLRPCGLEAVTRRSVRLIRPPSGSSVEVPGRMRSTPWKASRPSPPSTTASPEASRTALVGSLRFNPPTRNRPVSPSDSDTTGAAKSCFVLVLVQAHARVRRVVVDQAGLGRMRIAAELAPRSQDDVRNRRPRLAGFRMRRLIAIAARLVGHPAERAAIRHAHRHRLAGARHARHVKRRGRDDRAHGGEQSHPARRGRDSRA